MNNHGLLTGLVASALLSCGVCAAQEAPTVMTLEEIFAVAEQQSTQLRPAYSAQDEARREVEVARSRRLPDINASLSLSYIGDGFTTKRNFSDYQRAPIPHFGNTLTLGVTQPVYAGGGITAGIEMAELKLTASRYATELQRDNIRFGLAGFYLDIYKYTNLKKVVESNLDQAHQLLSQMRARYEQGVALHNDITRYELLVSNLQLELVKINNTLNILNHNLVTMAGLPAGMVICPDEAILTKALPLRDEGEWLSAASHNSPTLHLAQAQVDITRKADDLVKADSRPTVGLQAGWSTDGPILVEVPPINRNLSYWFVGVGVSYNLSSLYKNNKSRAKSRAAIVTATDNLAVARENTRMAVRADYVHYLESYEELKTQQKSVELADRNYNVVLARYNEDMALITDMLDAANSKLDAEQQLVNARINIIYYYYKLLFTSGTI